MRIRVVEELKEKRSAGSKSPALYSRCCILSRRLTRDRPYCCDAGVAGLAGVAAPALRAFS